MSKCICCGRENFNPSMGGSDICGWCDCGGVVEFGGIKYIRIDMLNAYRHILDKIPTERKDKE